MIRRIVNMTEGDWCVIELHNGKHYRLSGKEQAANKGLVADELAGSTTQDKLIDRRSSFEESEFPFLREFLQLNDGRTFRVRAENDDVFTVTADELKTMLTA